MQTKKSFKHIFTHKIAKARNLRKKRYCAALKGYITFKENKHLEKTYFALLRVAVHHHQALQFQEEVDDTSGWSPFGLENIHVKTSLLSRLKVTMMMKYRLDCNFSHLSQWQNLSQLGRNIQLKWNPDFMIIRQSIFKRLLGFEITIVTAYSWSSIIQIFL